jgi:putative ABC transport system ATP-binding protein
MATWRASAFHARHMISIRALEHQIDGKPLFAIPNWDVAPCSDWLITGANGIVLVHLLTGLCDPQRGQIIIQDQDIATLPPPERDFMRGDVFGIVFQNPRLLPALTVMQNMQIARSMSGKGESEQAFDAALRALGVDSLKDRKPHQLSAADAQRVAIARAIVTDPKLLILEEPTAGLDDGAANDMIHLIKQVCRYRKLTLLLFSNDIRLQGQLSHILTLEPAT